MGELTAIFGKQPTIEQIRWNDGGRISTQFVTPTKGSFKPYRPNDKAVKKTALNIKNATIATAIATAISDTYLGTSFYNSASDAVSSTVPSALKFIASHLKP